MKRCLIVVDMQNDFVHGTLGFDGALSIVPIIVEKLEEYTQNGEAIIFTQDTHHANYLTTEEGKHLPVAHCIKGTPGHDFIPEIKPYTKQGKIFSKPTFPSLELANYLRESPYDTIELCGLVANICVLSNAVMAKSACPNAEVIVDAKATRALDINTQQKTFDIMETLHIVVKNRG